MDPKTSIIKRNTDTKFKVKFMEVILEHLSIKTGVWQGEDRLSLFLSNCVLEKKLKNGWGGGTGNVQLILTNKLK